MRKHAADYYDKLKNTADSIRVTDKSGKTTDFASGVEAVGALLGTMTSSNKVMFIGNGGSAGIASHMAVDFWKNGRVRATAFNDGSLLTCIGNDYGYKHVFEKPIEMFADEGDLLVAISSSGRSENILLGVGAARAKKCGVVTLSGFDPDNPLSAMGDVNFYVPSHSYGPVEVLHHSICHCIMDAIMSKKNG